MGQWGGGTCSLAMPCSRRRVIPALKISTCPEQRQVPSPARGATPGHSDVPTTGHHHSPRPSCCSCWGPPPRTLQGNESPERPHCGTGVGMGGTGIPLALGWAQRCPCHRGGRVGTEGDGTPELPQRVSRSHGVPRTRVPPPGGGLGPPRTFGFGIVIELAHGHRVPCGETGTSEPHTRRLWGRAAPHPLLTPIPVLVVCGHQLLRGPPWALRPQQGCAMEAGEDGIHLHRVQEPWGTPGRPPALTGRPLAPSLGCQCRCGWHLWGVPRPGCPPPTVPTPG